MMHRFSQYGVLPVFVRQTGERPRARVYISPEDKRRSAVAFDSKRKRELNKSLGRCINHPLTENAPAHEAPVAPHVRCAACIAVHARSR